MYYPSLFESFFSPTRIVVVSEERLKAAELKVKQDELTAVEARIVELNKYKEELVTQVAQLKPARAGKDLDALDKEPQSLEEALTGG
jgi:tetrahydromethanopterin S-methyltransferase subunit G